MDCARREPFAALYRAHFDAVCGWARALGVSRPQDEDVAQEVFVVAHRRRDALRSPDLMRSWLFGITRRVVRDLRRGQVRREERRKHAQPPVPIRDPDEHVAGREATNLVEAFLAGLDEPKRLVFVLSVVDEMTAPEVAAALEIPVCTVRSRLRVARKRFHSVAQAYRVRESERLSMAS